MEKIVGYTMSDKRGITVGQPVAMIGRRGIVIVGTIKNPISIKTLLHILNFIAVDNRSTSLAARSRFVFTSVLLSSIRETVHAHIWQSNNAKRLIIVVILLGITMIVPVAVTFVLLSSFQKGNCEEMCQTLPCLETGVRVLKSMNETVQPCDDFFEFACRGWITNNPIPNHEPSWNTLKIIDDEIELRLHTILNTPDKEEDGRSIKMARTLYRTCMDSKSAETVKPLIDALTKVGLPIMPPTDEEAAHLDIPKIAGLALRHYGIQFFVGLIIDEDLNNSSMNQLVLQQVSPGAARLDVYLRDPVRFNAKLRAEKLYIRGLLVLAGMKEKNETYANETMNFMSELAKIMATPEERRSKNYTDHVVTIAELQNLTDPDVKHWNWTTYMNAVFDNTDVIVDPNNDIVDIYDMNYFKALPLLLSKTSRGTLARYAWSEVLFDMAPQTRQIYRDWGARFGKLDLHFEFGSPTWHGCTAMVKHYFEMALTAAYVKNHFNAQNKKTAIEMWTNLISSFDKMLTEYKWMDDKTKAQARRKLHAMNPLIAYPEWIMDPNKLEEHYKEYEVLEGSLVHMYKSFESIERKRHFNSWRQTVDRNTWSISGTEVNTYYSLSMNTLIIPAGILHEPFYGNAAESLNYGALGALVGHQVTRGFDSYGQQYDENTTVREWWSEESLKHYKEQVDCVIKQYSKYEVTQLGKNVTLDGILTEGENVADMGGLAMAFKAYKKLKAKSQPQQPIPGLTKYTDEQLFFLGYAQMLCDSFRDTYLKDFINLDQHSPGRFRIIGALQNSAEFANVWNCPSGSPMNPKEKCTMW